MEREELTIQNAIMFSLVMEDREICMEMLSRIFQGKKVIDIRRHEEASVETEKSIIVSLRSKSVRLDVLVEGSDEWIDLEMQVEDEGNIALRSRYGHSILDRKFFKRGGSYTAMKESYVIYICCFDPIGDGKALYTFSTREDGSLLQLEDKRFTIFLYTEGDRTGITQSLGDTLEYAKSGRVPEDDDFLARLDSKVREYRESEVGDEIMTLAEQMKISSESSYIKGVAKGKAEGIIEGKAEGKTETLLSLAVKGLISPAAAAEELGISEAEVLEMMN